MEGGQIRPQFDSEKKFIEHFDDVKFQSGDELTVSMILHGFETQKQNLVSFGSEKGVKNYSNSGTGIHVYYPHSDALYQLFPKANIALRRAVFQGFAGNGLKRIKALLGRWQVRLADIQVIYLHALALGGIGQRSQFAYG